MKTSGSNVSLYKGTFNWYGEVIKDLYAHAYSEVQAFNFLCKQVSIKVDRSLFDVRHYFYDSNKYEIKEVKKDGGDDEAVPKTKTCD